MLLFAASLMQVALAGTPVPESWLVASGTGNCSPTDVDFAEGGNGFGAGTFNCGLVTGDGGLTWEPVSVFPQQGQSLTWSGARTRDEILAARTGLYASSDRGATWSELGTLSQGIGSIFDVHFHDDDNIVLIKGGQIQASHDGGANWAITYPGEFNINFDELHFPTASIGFATGGIARSSGTIGTVLRTDDGGESWTLLEFEHGKITAAGFIDAAHALVATQTEGIFATSDGGESWSYVAPAPGPGLVVDLAHRDARHWYAVTSEGCVFESHDAGVAWEQGYCDSAGRALNALSVKGGAAVAVGNDGLVLFENRIFADGFEE